jgi:hypothetical protein
MRTMFAVLAVMTLVGCTTAAVPAVRQLADSPSTKSMSADKSGIPHIRYAEPRAFLRALGRVGSSLSIGDLAAIKDLTNWEPKLEANPGTGGVLADTDQRTLDSNVTRLVLGFVPASLENERGALRLLLRPDRYCIQFDDAVSVFGKPTRLYEPSLHARPPPRVTPVYTAVFSTSERSRIYIDFEYQECARALHVFKNIQ